MGKLDRRSQEQDGASSGKIFVGGLPRDTTLNAFKDHFEKYGEIRDSVIMKDKHTSQPRGFGFITYADPSVVDKVIQDTHVFNKKTVEIKRTIPKGSVQFKDFKTKKIFVGGIPPIVTEDEFKKFFSKYGEVVNHEIIRDHSTNRPRGFGFIVFDSEQVVEDLLSQGNMIDLAGSQVEIKKAEPKNASNPPPPSFGSQYRTRSFSDGFGGFDNSSRFDRSEFDPHYNRTLGFGSRLGSAYGGYGGTGEFGSGYGGYRGETSLGYSNRFGSYVGGYGMGYGGGNFGGYGHGEEGFGGSYETGPGGSYGSGGSYGTAGLYGNRGGYGTGAPGRYHPYAR